MRNVQVVNDMMNRRPNPLVAEMATVDLADGAAHGLPALHAATTMVQVSVEGEGIRYSVHDAATATVGHVAYAGDVLRLNPAAAARFTAIKTGSAAKLQVSQWVH